MTKSNQKCRLCGKLAGKPQEIDAEFRGIGFSIFKKACVCTNCCRALIIDEVKRLEYEKYFEINEGIFTINWTKCVKAYATFSQEHNPWDELTFILIMFGILSPATDRNFMIMRDGQQFCLHHLGEKLYFTDSEDAEGFARAYANHYSQSFSLTIQRFQSPDFTAVQRFN